MVRPAPSVLKELTHVARFFLLVVVHPAPARRLRRATTSRRPPTLAARPRIPDVGPCRPASHWSRLATGQTPSMGLSSAFKAPSRLRTLVETFRGRPPVALPPSFLKKASTVSVVTSPLCSPA